MVFIISRMANDQSAPPFMKFVIPRTAPAGLFIFIYILQALQIYLHFIFV